MAWRNNLVFLLPLYLFITAALGQWYWYENYQNQLQINHAQLKQFESQLSSQLEKYAYIPRLLSKDRELIDALQQPTNSAQIEITNRYLDEVNSVIKAADTYLLDINGTTLASSNWDKASSFIGRNFAFRPYFQQAVLGDTGQYFALGSTSGKRGYYYSFPIIYAAEIVGVVVVKMDLYPIESQWPTSQSIYTVTDADNIIFMSNKREWLLHSLSELDSNLLATIRENRRYADIDIRSLGFMGDLANSRTELKRSNFSFYKQQFLTQSQTLDTHPLTVRVIYPKANLYWDLIGFLFVLHLIYALLLFLYLLQRNTTKRKQLIAKINAEAKQKLEFEVMERTSKLHAEIDERAKTEEQLRVTQSELIQAAKLAVLGQMSTSISHELNNPLAAIRSYSNNGRKYLQKGMVDKAEDNFARISSLTHRMKKISQQLKSFARDTSNDDWLTQPITTLIDTSIELVLPQAKSHVVNIDRRYLKQLEGIDIPRIKVNTIQFEQVLINILSNAIQALETIEVKDISVQVEASETNLSIHIDDSGRGVSEEHKLTLFDPFISSKSNGMGLGLSLSLSIIQNMNGDIAVTKSPLGGARFSVVMPLDSSSITQESHLL
jgi:two-component system C4-dicarboxylate transport sensor histidine kinase DctB